MDWLSYYHISQVFVNLLTKKINSVKPVIESTSIIFVILNIYYEEDIEK